MNMFTTSLFIRILTLFRSISSTFKGVRLQGRFVGLGRNDYAASAEENGAEYERKLASFLDNSHRMHDGRYARRYCGSLFDHAFHAF